MAELYNQVRPVFVPGITEDTLRAMVAWIKPLIRMPDGYWTITIPKDLYAPYLWEARTITRVGEFNELNHIKIITFHHYTDSATFEPSVAEVMANILRFVPEWKHVGYFSLQASSLGSDHVIGDCHWCYCDLYGDAQ